MKKSRRGSRLALLAILAAASCRVVDPFIKVKIEIPPAPAFRLEAYREIVLIPFWRENEPKEFDLNQTLLGFIEEIFKRSFKGKLIPSSVAWENVQTAENKDFWKKAVASSPGRLILTGKAQFSQDVRKALLGQGRRPVDDGPFAPEKAWAERLNYTLKLDLYFIKPESGEVAFTNHFQESLTYEDQKQRAEFAIYDLLERVRLKLFRLIFGGERPQERYLLIR